MATFSQPNFSHANYAAKRPAYPEKLYDILLKYHQGPRGLVVDLGCGHGLVARALSPSFERVIGTDPSPGMLDQARRSTVIKEHPNVSFEAASAEQLSFIDDASVDMIASGQAAHWFDFARWWPEMRRVLRPGGTLAIWGYKDPVLVDHAAATAVLSEYAYGAGGDRLGDYWSQPGRTVVQGQYTSIIPPPGEWSDVTRVDYEPTPQGRHRGEGTILLEQRWTLRNLADYVRTWSSYHKWAEAHPQQQRISLGGSGDLVDAMLDAMREQEPTWQEAGHLAKEVDLEWGSGLLMARRV